jgi:hypothetical protein
MNLVISYNRLSVEFTFLYGHVFNRSDIKYLNNQFHFDTKGDIIRHGYKNSRFFYVAHTAFPNGAAHVCGDA